MIVYSQDINYVLLISQQILWAFSIYSEAVAVLPQIFLMAKTGKNDEVIFAYLFVFGLYRGLYVAHWMYQYLTYHHFDVITLTAGIVHVNVCFGWYFIRKLFSLIFVEKVVARSAAEALLPEKGLMINTVSADIPQKLPNPVVHVWEFA